jgi:hypothetical protein
MAEPVVVGILDWTGSASMEDINNTPFNLKTFTIVFQVLSNFDIDTPDLAAYSDPLAGDTPNSIMNAAGLPMPFSPCPFDNSCRSTKMSVKRKHTPNEKGKYWEVTCEYTNKPIKWCHEVTFDNPLLQPPVISVTTQGYQGTAQFHYDTAVIPGQGFEIDPNTGLPIPVTVYEIWNRALMLRMSNGTEMTDIERDFFKIQVSISYNVPAFDPAICYGWLNHVNALPLWGFEPYTTKYTGFSWSREYWGACLSYCKISFTFDIQLIMGYDRAGIPVIGFRKRVLDHGTRYVPDGKESSMQNLVVARTADGSGEIDICLDGTGHALPGQVNQYDTATNVPFNPDNMYFHNVQPYPMANLAQLGIPLYL